MREIEIGDHSSIRQIVDELKPNDEVVLTRGGEPVARLKAELPKQKLRLGLGRGQFTLPDDFDAPLPDDVLALFYDSPIFPERPAGGEEVEVPDKRR